MIVMQVSRRKLAEMHLMGNMLQLQVAIGSNYRPLPLPR